jgi:hypothetical protein
LHLERSDDKVTSTTPTIRERTMSTSTPTERLDHAVESVRRAAQRIRHSAHELLDDDQPDHDPGASVRAADALGALSRRLEEVAEGAGRAGLAVRDRGRDGARTLARGERTLREGGLLAGAARTLVVARRNAVGIGLGAAALAALVYVARRDD